MQFKGLVKFFSIALIVISIYQLHFTFIVNSFEDKIVSKANKELKKLSTTLSQFQKDSAYKKIYRRILDSSSKTIVTYGVSGAIDYKTAKEQELNLGLDLQGGMNVTLNIKLEDLIRNLSNNPKDVKLNAILSQTEIKRKSSNTNYIDLFYQTFKENETNKNLAFYFSDAKNIKVKKDVSDNTVLKYIQDEVDNATKRTFDILQTRIDKFGVSQPSVNLDVSKGIINVELAGNQEDPERVRKYLQATANLQFWEVHNIEELAPAFSQLAQLVNEQQKPTTPASTKTNKEEVKNKKDTNTNNAKSSVSDFVSKKDTSKSPSAILKTNVFAQALQQIQYYAQQVTQKGGQVNKVPFMFQIETKNLELFESTLAQESVASILPSNVKFLYGIKEKNADENLTMVYAIKTLEDTEGAKLEGDNIEEAQGDYDERGRPAVTMRMSKSGEKIWEEMTRQNIGMPIAIVLDNLVYSAPNVNSVISGGSSLISGNFTVQEATDLANILKSGKLPVQAQIVQEQIVGPTLGEEAIKGGLYSFLIAFLIIAVLMWVYYSTGGTVANVSLILNLLFTIGVLSALGASLTAPGIAGLVLTIGMAVDTNVIIFERIKEELSRGGSYLTAIANGYKRSLAPVLDAHVITFLTAVILFYFGLGPIKGFATTQMLGIVLSLLCGILISKQMSDWFTNKQRHFNYFTNISKKVFQHSTFPFVKYRKVAYVVSVIVLILGVVSFFKGFDEGVEFKGGRSYTVKFEKEVDIEKMRTILHQSFENDNPILKTIGDKKQINITTSYLIDQTGKEVDSKVEKTLYEGIKSFLPENTSFEDFSSKYKMSSMTILPTISEDLKAGSVKATIVSLILIFLYILIRFRKWQYSLGTIIALFHDVLIMLIVFSFCKDFVSFPLEIDQHFIAAILTVIGFSMNDTVIVFDRVREYTKSMAGVSNKEIINKAVNDTLSRTIMTSATVFITILILFIFGGEVTRGFSFAMMIGVLTGTYSSIFVAAPILVDLDKNKK